MGAGVFGVTAALALRERGHPVSLLDPGPLPHPLAASTDISKLIRADYGRDGVFSDLGRRALEGWERWNEGPGRALYHPDGVLMVSRQAMAPGGFEGDSWDTLGARGWALARRRGPALARHHPAWTLGPDADGYLNPRGGWAESGAVVARLLDQAVAAGVSLRPGVRVDSLRFQGDRVSGVAWEGGRLDADTVVVAAGAWTPRLVPWLADRLWATGHPILLLRPDDPAAWRAPHFPAWAADIARTGFYGFPANADGVVKIANHGIGVPTDPDGPRVLAPGTHAHFRRFLAASLPGLASAPIVDERLCLYCDSFDGDFWIDRDPARVGLVVAAGGSGHGFKFAPLLGDWVADAVEGIRGPDAHRSRWRGLGAPRTEDARYDGDGS